MFDKEKLDLLEESVLEIIQNIGIRVEDDYLLDLLSESGAKIDKKNKISKFPINMTEENIKYFKNMTSIKKSEENDFKFIIEGGGSPFIIKDTSNNRQKASRTDLINIIKLGDTLDEIKMISDPITYTENDARVDFIEKCALLLTLTKKKVHVEITNKDVIKYAVRMAELFNVNPIEFMTADNAVISPLICGKHSIEILLEMVKYKIPALTAGTMLVSGLNAPVTLAGAIALGSAEIVCGLMINRVINEKFIGRLENLNIHGILITGSFDMRTLDPCWASPEADLQDIGINKLLKERFFIPTRFFPRYIDSKIPSIKGAYERTLKQLSYELLDKNKSDLFDRGLGVGSLGGGLVFSPVQAILDIEFGKGIMRLTKGVRINKDTIALDVIKEVGIGGNFLNHDHTLKNFKDEFWFSDFLYKSIQGKEDKLLDYAYTKYQESIKNYTEPYIDVNKEKELKKLLEFAKEELQV
jgi:trimethylamine--corrinoid protein Co-methyltransferase